MSGKHLCVAVLWVLSAGQLAGAAEKGGADALLIIASTDKIGVLSRHMSEKHPEKSVYFAIQRGTNDIWSAIEESFAYPADVFLFAMPDTLYSR